LFVLMGNFTARGVGGGMEGVKNVADAFDALGNMIGDEFPRIARKAKFIFIPGPLDPGGSGVFPLSPLPSMFTKVLSSRLSHFNAAGNPCRVRFYTQEIVFFRDGLIGKLQGSSVVGEGGGGERGGGVGGGGGGGTTEEGTAESLSQKVRDDEAREAKK